MSSRSAKLSATAMAIMTIILISLFNSSHQNKFTAAATNSELQQRLSIEQFLQQNFPQTSKALPLSQEGAQFDSSAHKSVYEAIKAHPDLREVSAFGESDFALGEALLCCVLEEW